MNFVSQNVVLAVPQRSAFDVVAITNNSYQSIECCFSQQTRESLYPITTEGNSNVQYITLYEKINSVSHNLILEVPQTSIYNADFIKNNFHKSIEGCIGQQPKQPLSSITVEGNGNV